MKKIFKFTLLGLLIFLLVPVLLGGAYLSYFYLKNSSDKNYVSYLKANSEVILPDHHPEIHLFDDSFYNNKLFLLGESHGFKMPHEIDIKLLEHLKHRIKNIQYIAEVDLIQAYYLNLYISKGNEEDLKRVFKFWKQINAQWGSQENYDKFKRLRALNHQLPETEKINIYGVDKFQDLSLMQYYLLQSLDTLVTDSLVLANLKGELNKEKAAPANIIKLLQQIDLKKEPAHFNLNSIITNLNYVENGIRRDSVMYLNFKDLINNEDESSDKYYGLFGFHHVMQEEVNGHLSFVGLVKHHTQTPVVSIATYAVDSKMMLPTIVVPEPLRDDQEYIESSLVNSDGPLVFTEGINDLKIASNPHSATLYKINNPNSPYNSSTRLVDQNAIIGGSLRGTDKDARTSDFFQYIILIRNSDAAQPVKLDN